MTTLRFCDNCAKGVSDMTLITKLKPCPFCGSTEIETYCQTADREGTPRGHFCADCGAYGPWEYSTNGKANHELWNNRARLREWSN